MKIRPVHFYLAIFGLLLATNRWMFLLEGINFAQATDAFSYLAMAAAAPALPKVLLPFHHAQRIFIHYVIGTSSWLTGIGLEKLYFLFVFGLAFGISLFFLGLIKREKVGRWASFFLASIFFLNPYTFRYYFLVPPMLADLFFVLGLAVLLTGLAQERFTLVLIGAVAAVLGRQSALLMVPGVAYWMLGAWPEAKRKSNVLRVLFLTFLMGGVFVTLKKIALPFSGGEIYGPEIFLSLFAWLLSGSASIRVFLEHLLRVFLPFFMIGSFGLAVFWARPGLRGRIFSVESVSLLLISLSILCQPLLMDPVHIALQNQSRLSAIGLLPMVLVFARFLKGEELVLGRMKWFILPILALSSLHHLYSVVGPSDATQFAVLQIILALAFGVSLAWALTRSKSSAASIPSQP